MAENIKVPEKHYVGMQRRSDTALPLGFMTPWGEDAAAKKRIATVDRWAAGSNKLPSMVIDNKPMSGFRLSTTIRTTNYGGYDHWRIEDPRGFELEISSGNLAQLLAVGALDRGDILDECVWARHGKDNVLLSTSTDEYRKATENTTVAGMKARWRDVKLGNKVVLQNNLRGIWYGQMRIVHRGWSHSHTTAIGENQISTTAKSYHVILVESKIGHSYDTELHFIASPKLAFIADASEEITAQEAEIRVNGHLGDPRCCPHVNAYRRPLLATFDEVTCGNNLTLDLDQVEIADENELSEMVKYEMPTLLARTSAEFGVIHRRYHRGEMNIESIMEEYLAQGEFRTAMIKSPKRVHFWSSTDGNQYEAKTASYTWDPATQFFNLRISVATKAGNTLSTLFKL